MKTPKIFLLLSLIVSLGLLTQCEKYGDRGGIPDDDSDRPEWAGGNTDENPHSKGNDDSGTTKGGDYGDLYILDRTVDGVPIMTWIDLNGNTVEDEGEHFVQPIREDGSPVDLNEEGEVINPEEAQEVEFGRLNIVRSPTSVLDQAFNEALKVLAAPGAIISLDFCGRLTSTYPDGEEFIVKTIDSPRENMAIYRTIMQDLFDDRLEFLGDYDPLMVAASCFAAGSDKTGFVDKDEVVYINGFMDCTGNNEILNEWEFDFNNNVKYYYNFSDPEDNGNPFVYDRTATYENRYIQFLVWNNTYYPDDENGVSEGPVFTILDIFEGHEQWLGIGNKPEFTYVWGAMSDEAVEGFAMAVDDAVQVLDFVHGDSNVRFLPDYTPWGE